MSDTQPPMAPQGQTYGQAGAQIDAQKVQPVAGKPSTPAPPLASGVTPTQPGEIPGMTDPSALPDEPVTSGLASGPGAGPDALATGSPEAQELAILKLIFAKYPTEDIRRLIEFTENSLPQPQAFISPQAEAPVLPFAPDMSADEALNEEALPEEMPPGPLADPSLPPAAQIPGQVPTLGEPNA